MSEPGNEAWLCSVHTFVIAGAGQGTTAARQDDAEEPGGQFADHQMSSGYDAWDMNRQITSKQPGCCLTYFCREILLFSFIAFMYICVHVICLQLFILAAFIQSKLKCTTVFFV